MHEFLVAWATRSGKRTKKSLSYNDIYASVSGLPRIPFLTALYFYFPFCLSTFETPSSSAIWRVGLVVTALRVIIHMTYFPTLCLDRICGISIADSTATTDTHGSTSETYGRWNIASQRGSWQLRTTRVRHPTDDRHNDDDNGRDGT